MSSEGPEARLIKAMRKAGRAEFGDDFVCTKYHGGPFSEAGVSDLFGTVRGWFWVCEVKAPESYGNSEARALEKGPTTNQREYLRKVNAAGGVGTVAVNVEQFLETLRIAATLSDTGGRVRRHATWMDGVLNDPIICTCISDGVCDYVRDPEFGCFFCRNPKNADLPCPNNPD